MSIIERTTKLQLTQFEGSSINPAILDYYTADMAIIDSAFSDADTRLTALESTFQGHADRLDALEAWKTDTVNPTLSDYGTRIGALETWKVDTVTVELADHADRLTALETWKTDTVTVELASLDSRVDAIEQIIHDLSVEGYYDLVARLDALEAKVETNSNDITTLNSNLTRLDNRLTEDEADIVNLGNGIVALSNRVTLLEGCCEEVRGVLADHNTRINKNASDIAELDARLTRDEANISGNASDIVILANQNSTQSDQIQDLYDKYNSIDPDMPTNLYSRVGALETVVGDDALQTTAQTLTGAVNELVAGITDVDADEVDYSNSDSGLTATDVQGAIDEVNGKVDVDSARVGALETTVGGAGSGLVKAVDDLTTDVGTLETTVGDSNSGLVKDVADLGTTVGDATAGLVKDVADVQEVIPTGASSSNKLATENDLLDIYSTTEQRIGTWIDGKPLYRKVLSGDTIPADGDVLLSNVAYCVKVYGMTLYDPQNVWFDFPYYDQVNNKTQRTSFDPTSHTINFLGTRTDVSKYRYVAIYTKTTD